MSDRNRAALEALTECIGVLVGAITRPEKLRGVRVDWIQERADIIRAALTQQAEPVAWLHATRGTQAIRLTKPEGEGAKLWRPLYAAPPAATDSEREEWIADPDTIPKSMIDACANQITREFGDPRGTDGYYKRIIAATLAADPARLLRGKP